MAGFSFPRFSFPASPLLRTLCALACAAPLALLIYLFFLYTIAESNYKRGLSLYSNGQKRDAVVYYQKAAEQGLAAAQFNLAIMFFKGDGVPPNKNKAAEWFQKAAEQGDAQAQYSLAHMLYRGDGIPQDKTKAAEWYQKAAEQGYAEAQRTLGTMLLKGDGIPKDVDKGQKWLQKAKAPQ